MLALRKCNFIFGRAVLVKISWEKMKPKFVKTFVTPSLLFSTGVLTVCFEKLKRYKEIGL